MTDRTRRILARLVGRDDTASEFYIDDDRELLAIPVDSTRVYRQLPLSASR